MAQVVFRQSLVPFSLLGVPAALVAMQLIRLGAWGLGVFPASDPFSRQVYALGPLLLGLAILASLVLIGLHSRVSYRVTSTTLFVGRPFRPLEAWPLERLYVCRRQGSLFGGALLSDGYRTMKVQRLFLPRFDRFCRLLQVLTRMRRQVEEM